MEKIVKGVGKYARRVEFLWCNYCSRFVFIADTRLRGLVGRQRLVIDSADRQR